MSTNPFVTGDEFYGTMSGVGQGLMLGIEQAFKERLELEKQQRLFGHQTQIELMKELFKSRMNDNTERMKLDLADRNAKNVQERDRLNAERAGQFLMPLLKQFKPQSLNYQTEFEPETQQAEIPGARGMFEGMNRLNDTDLAKALSVINQHKEYREPFAEVLAGGSLSLDKLRAGIESTKANTRSREADATFQEFKNRMLGAYGDQTAPGDVENRLRTMIPDLRTVFGLDTPQPAVGVLANLGKLELERLANADPTTLQNDMLVRRSGLSVEEIQKQANAALQSDEARTKRVNFENIWNQRMASDYEKRKQQTDTGLKQVSVLKSGLERLAPLVEEHLRSGFRGRMVDLFKKGVNWFSQVFPDVKQIDQIGIGLLGPEARQLMTEVGVLTNPDIERAAEGFKVDSGDNLETARNKIKNAIFFIQAAEKAWTDYQNSALWLNKTPIRDPNGPGSVNDYLPKDFWKTANIPAPGQVNPTPSIPSSPGVRANPTIPRAPAPVAKTPTIPRTSGGSGNLPAPPSFTEMLNELNKRNGFE